MTRSEIPPDTLLGGRIRLIKRIGRGGMGDVWVARNESTQAELAIKTLHRSERGPQHDERFRREARLSATISHRNVVRVFDLVDETDGTLGLVMELLRGGTLEELLKDRGTLPAAAAVAVALPVLSAMHHVHEKGIVHRDMKPANVFFAVEPDGHVIPKVLDFGIAKIPTAGSALTADSSVLGTPHYMSPEQIRSRADIDGRSDMFAFAVVFYEMLTGVRVFQRDAAAASLAAVLEHDPEPDPRIEPRLWAALSRALAKRPQDRYATCADLAAALRGAVDATDEELATALQTMRPRTELLSSSTSAPSSLSAATGSPHLPLRRMRGGVSMIVAGVAAMAAVILVVTLSLALKPSKPASASVSTSAPPASEPRVIVPPPQPPAPQPAPVVTADPKPLASAAPASKSTPAVAPTRRPAPPSGGDRKPKPKTPGGVATTPGF